MIPDRLIRHVVAAIESDASSLIGAELCPDPSWPNGMSVSLHEAETSDGAACWGCGAVV